MVHFQCEIGSFKSASGECCPGYCSIKNKTLAYCPSAHAAGSEQNYSLNFKLISLSMDEIMIADILAGVVLLNKPC